VWAFPWRSHQPGAPQASCDLGEEFWAELCAAFTEMGLLELLRLIGKQVCILTNALRLEFEAGARRIPR